MLFSVVGMEVLRHLLLGLSLCPLLHLCIAEYFYMLYYSFTSFMRCCRNGVVNGSQLAKMKKSIPDMSLPLNL